MPSGIQKTGLFFGSFNPVHNGHMMLANYLLEYTDLSEIWFVVSPHNPLKPKKGLLDDHHRLEMVNLAINDFNGFQACDIEFRMPKPSYTIHTLTYLTEKYPLRHFVLIVGGDNLESFHKWKNPEAILDQYEVYVYARPGYEGGGFAAHRNVRISEAPLLEVSSSFIRDSVRKGKDIRFFMPERAYRYMKEMNFYKK
jgi:nicotinate-nucleotide adenylyltransferase